MLVVDEILELLKNGEWHGLGEIADKSGLGKRKVELVANLLCEFDFLECDVKERRVKLSPQLLVFLRRVEDLEREEMGSKKSSGVLAFLRVVGSSLVCN